MDEVRGTGYFASPVLNHPMTWSFALTQETPILSKYVKRIVRRCLVSILGWKDLCNSLRHVTLPYHPLEIAKLGVA